MSSCDVSSRTTRLLSNCSPNLQLGVTSKKARNEETRKNPRNGDARERHTKNCIPGWDEQGTNRRANVSMCVNSLEKAYAKARSDANKVDVAEIECEMRAKMLLLSFLLLTSVSAALTQAIAFENAVEEEPTIDCQHNQIRLFVKTSKQTPSHIFAKGHFGKEGCSFSGASNATFSLDGCNMLRKREVGPKGLSYSMTVIIQLHPLFITKVDRAYNVRCFYMESDKEVSNGITVNELSTETLEVNNEVPKCSYTLHRDSPNGPIIKYSSVGDVIYHVWSCESEIYSMLVHDCGILNGQGRNEGVIDSDGCSTDNSIMPELSYSDAGTRTFTASSAFNFPDSTTVFFNCKIKLCVRNEEGCNALTPPKCGVEKLRDDTLQEELNSDQLIQSSTRPSPSTAPRTTTMASTTTEAFPSPKEFVLDAEGSGQEETTIITEATTVSHSTTTSESVVSVSTGTIKGNRSQRHTKKADPSLELELNSPELTMLERADFEQSPSASQALSSAEKFSTEGRVCVPQTIIWVFISLSVSSIAIFAVVFYYTRRCSRKSYSY
uniref:ZP domain-containing protein n=1 Tax=Steinernema glaseri TaxID=37863 RepID=A0A1I8AWQ7_9BILA